MGFHPINLALRFLLELSALAAMGFWSYNQSDGWIRFILMLVVPIIAAAIWGIFAVPDDQSRSGAAPISVPGILRLALELAFFAFAVWTMYDLGYTRLGLILGITIVIHYIISYDRILWLMKQ